MTITVMSWVGNLSKREARNLVPLMQIALFVMVRGGFLGRSYAEQPATAYTDARCGKLPYKAREVETARVHLVEVAKRAGYDPDHLPAMPSMRNMGGVFYQPATIAQG